ncbi:MFS transporter [Clostridium sp. D2Q-11]|uniref:MFS transporter n=1 Tax=Anaeromonas frigoriresistens TaxID=2683708 RepID=A0A942UVU6_9FIRM|nr:MFS transporter [Anaeromonas frigoriresistens]MBS4538995.1 MFS transporter [Anaeromonas frigoriresistens]
MNNNMVTTKFSNKFFYYGYIIIFIAAMGLMFSGPGQTYSISLFIDSYIKNFSWGRSLVASLYSGATLLASFILPSIGRKIDELGHRKMMTIIPICLSITCFFMSFVFSPIMLFIGFVFLRLFGQGSMTLLSSTLVPQWFEEKRGLALSLMSIGGVIGSALFPLLNNTLILNTSVEFTWRVLSLSLVLIMAPMGYSLVRNRPEDLGLLPDNKDVNDSKNHDMDKEILKNSWTAKEAMKTRAFWFMMFCMTIPSFINTAIVFHIVSIFKDQGFSSTFAASVLSIIALTQFPLTFVAGFVVDKIKVHYIKAINYLILFISMLFLYLGINQHMLIFYGVFNGLFIAFDSVSTNALWPNYFGRKHLGSIRSMSMTAMVIGSSAGPIIYGLGYDIFKGYGEIILITLIFPILGSIASFLSPAPKKDLL